MTLPVWDPTNKATFTVNVADLAYIVIDDLTGIYFTGVPGDPKQPGQLAIFGVLFDEGAVPPMQLLPRAQDVPAASLGNRISVTGGTFGHVQLSIARTRSLSTLTARWVDFRDANFINFDRSEDFASELRRFTAEVSP